METHNAAHVVLTLLLTCTPPGLGKDVGRYPNPVNASVGQNVSLWCPVEDVADVHVSQIEWKMRGPDGRDTTKLLVFSLSHKEPYRYRHNISLQVQYSGEKVSGSILQLPAVGLWDSGYYVCELTTFPHGSKDQIIRLLVTEAASDPPSSAPASTASPPPRLTAAVMGGAQLSEGDDLRIVCNSSPRADMYTLVLPSNRQIKMETGYFTLPNVTRNDSGIYVCQPQRWSPPHIFQGYNSTVSVTVHYLDAPECNTSSIVRVYPADSVTVSCTCRASRPVRFSWVKEGNRSVSNASVLHLPSVTRADAGIYTVTVETEGPPGRRSKAALNVTVQTRISASTSRGVTHHSTSISTVQTSGDPTEPSLTSSSGTTAITPTHAGRSSAATAPQHSGSTSHLSTRTSAPSAQTTGGPPTTSPGSKSYVWLVFPHLALVAVLLTLFVRCIRKRRMDMPPSFKPPPPPVKYTSIHIPVLDITECNRKYN